MPGPLLADLARSAVGQGRGQRRAASGHAGAGRATSSRSPRPTPSAESFAAGGRLFTFGNGGSSTDAASLAALFARPPWGAPAAGPLAGRRHRGPDRARATTWASTWCSPASSSPTPRAGDIALGLSTSGSSRNLLTAFARGAGPRPAHRRPGGLRRRRDGRAPRDVQHCLVVRSDSVHRIQETQAALGFALWAAVQRRTRGLDRWVRSADREASVLERIEAFRRRRPAPDRRRRHAWPTAPGGKASAALVDAVFLDAFAGGPRPPLPLADAATLTLPTGERLAFTTDSFVVQPLRFPGGSIGHLAVHGTVNDLAVMGARPAWLSAAFVIEEGFPIAELRAIAADMADGRGGRRRRHRHRRHQGGRPRARPTASTSRPPASASSRPDATLGPERVRAGRRRAGVGHDRRPRHGGDAGPGRPRARGRHPLRHRAPGRPGRGAARRRALAPAGCGTRPGAGSAPSATSWPATPTWPCCSTRRSCRWTRRSPARATCSASTRCTWPTRARSSPSSPPTRPTPRWRRCAPTRSAPAPPGSARWRPSPRASSCCSPSFGGTRIVDMLVGDPLPRIC